MKQNRCRICRQPLKNEIYGSRCEDCYIDGFIYRQKNLSALRRRHENDLKTIAQMRRKAG